MSAYLQRLAQRTGLASAGNPALAAADAVASLEVDLYREVASSPAMAADPGPGPGPESIPPPPAASMAPTASFEVSDAEAPETAPIDQPPRRPALEQRSLRSAARPRRPEPGPLEPVTPAPARRAGPESSEPRKDTSDDLGPEKKVETQPPGPAAVAPAPRVRPNRSPPRAETSQRSGLEPTPSPGPTPEARLMGVPARPRLASTARTPTAAPAPAPAQAPPAGPVRRTYAPNPPPRPATIEATGGRPPSVRIGSVHLEVHQAPPPPAVAPPPARTPRPAPARAPRPLSLRRLYLRSW